MKTTFNRTNQIKIGVIISYVNTLLTMLIGIVFAPFLLQMIGPSQHGIYNHVTSLTGQIGVLNFGFGATLIRYVAKYRAEHDKEGESNFIGLSVVFYAAISVIVLLIGLYICTHVRQIYSGSEMTLEELRMLPKLIGVMTALLAITMPANVLSGIITAYEQFAFLKLQSLTMLIIRTAAVVAALFVWKYAMTIILIDVIISLVTIGINLWYIKKHLNIQIRIRGLERAYVFEVFGFTFFVFLNEIVARVNWSLDKTILLLISSAVAVSMYSVAMNVVNMYMVSSTAIADLLLPKVTQMMVKQASGKELTDLMIKVGRFQLMILSYIMIIFSFFGQEFITVWVGKQYSGIPNAVHTIWLTAMMIMVPFSLVLFQNTGISILQAHNKHKFRSVILVFVSVFNVLLTIFLVNRIGIVGAAIGTGISLLVGNVIIINIYYHMKMQIDMVRFYRETLLNFILPLIGIGIIAFLLNFISGCSWITLILRCMCLFIMYIAVIWLFVLHRNEKDQLINILVKFNRRKK